MMDEQSMHGTGALAFLGTIQMSIRVLPRIALSDEKHVLNPGTNKPVL
jgi:hypothetical protein